MEILNIIGAAILAGFGLRIGWGAAESLGEILLSLADLLHTKLTQSRN